MSEAPTIKKIKMGSYLQDDDNFDYTFALAFQTHGENDTINTINSDPKKDIHVDLSLTEMESHQKTVPLDLSCENSFYKKNFDLGNTESYDPNEILDYYEKGDNFDGYYGDVFTYRYPGHSPQVADEPTQETLPPLNYVEPPNLPPLGPVPSQNHYQYQSAKVSAPSTVTSERSLYCPQPPAHGLAFPYMEQQQYPQYHFEEESRHRELPSVLSTNVSRSLQNIPLSSQTTSHAATSQTISGLSGTASSSVPVPGLNPNNASSLVLCKNMITSKSNFPPPQAAQTISSTMLTTSTNSYSQVKNSIMTSVIKTTSVGGQEFPFQTEQQLSPLQILGPSNNRVLPPPYSTSLSSQFGTVNNMTSCQIKTVISEASFQTTSSPVNATNICKSVKTEKKKNYSCQSCSKAYIGRAGLARHYRSYPLHGSLTEEKPQQIANKAPPRPRIIDISQNEEKFKKFKNDIHIVEEIELDKENDYGNLLALTEVGLVQNVEKFDCPICFSEINAGQGVTLQECLHSFCRECLIGVIQFSETPLVKCPFQNNEYKCEYHLQEREVKSLVTPEMYEKHLQKSLALAETQAQNSFHCKTPDCPGWCFFEDNVNIFICPVCNRRNCMTCSAVHEGKNCKEYQEEVELETSHEARKTKKLLKSLLHKGKAMRCPTCQVIIVKKGGCDTMSCSMCGAQFVWDAAKKRELPLPSLERLASFGLNAPNLPKAQVITGIPEFGSSEFVKLWLEQSNGPVFPMSLSTKLANVLAQTQAPVLLPVATATHSQQLNNPLLQNTIIIKPTLLKNTANSTVTITNSQNGGEPRKTELFEYNGVAPVVTIDDSDSNESKKIELPNVKEKPEQTQAKAPIIVNIRKQNDEKYLHSDDNLHGAKETAMQIQSDYDRLLALADVDLVPNVEKFDCPICFSEIDVGEGVTLQECLHSFCRECLAGAVKFSETPVVKCPFQNDDYKCESSLLEREVKALVTPEIYEKYLQRSMVLAENQAENSFHCKTPDCPGWCLFEDEVNIFKCPVCNHTNCLTCSAIHEGKNCAQYQQDVELDSNEDTRKTKAFLQKMLDSGTAMRCPKCQIVLMKKTGCDWLICSMCRTEICWVTRGSRWGPKGYGDYSGGCRCKLNGVRCHPKCGNCH